MATLGRIRDEFKAIALNTEKGKDFSINLKVVTARKPLIPGHMAADSVMGSGLPTESSDDSTIGA